MLNNLFINTYHHCNYIGHCSYHGLPPAHMSNMQTCMHAHNSMQIFNTRANSSIIYIIILSAILFMYHACMHTVM